MDSRAPFYRSAPSSAAAQFAMIYALNVFNQIPGKEDDYRDYSVRADRIIYRFGGKVVSAGCA